MTDQIRKPNPPSVPPIKKPNPPSNLAQIARIQPVIAGSLLKTYLAPVPSDDIIKKMETADLDSLILHYEKTLEKIKSIVEKRRKKKRHIISPDNTK